MSSDDVKLETGKSYNIDYVIQELEKAPDIQLGHIVVVMTREHKYHVSKLQLEDIAKKIKRKIVEGGKEYEKVGKRFVPLTDITILSITDPFEKYRKYDKFYLSLEPQIVKGIADSKKDSVAAPTEVLIREARKIVTIDDEKEFLGGLGMFFKRRGITTNPIQEGKYILFEKHKPLETRRVTVIDAEAKEREYEKYRVYTGFYEDFFKQIAEGMTVSKKGEIAAPINAIISEAQKLGFVVVGKEKDFLKGMDLYFNIRGIATERADQKYVIFKKRY